MVSIVCNELKYNLCHYHKEHHSLAFSNWQFTSRIYAVTLFLQQSCKVYLMIILHAVSKLRPGEIK